MKNLKCLYPINKIMIKCKCVKCGNESAYTSHKQAWMEGWDFIGKVQYCGECSVMPTDPLEKLPTELTKGYSE